VVLLVLDVADDNEPDVFRRDARVTQRYIFGDGVILAIAALRPECFERRAPAVSNAPLRKVAGRDNR
jgi:hypothetical protein